jgi:hypothetical protein
MDWYQEQESVVLIYCESFCFQRGASYCVTKIFTSLPSNIKNLRNNEVKFKIELHMYLITHSLYSLTEFFNNNTSNAYN